MADDIMEISSEHGNNGGDEDIDIDIDLTAGQVDEDYVLEDATSNAGVEDDDHHHRSPVIGNDDLMIDDGDEAYTIHDPDLVPELDNQSMEAESPTMSFAAVDESANRPEDDTTLETSHFINEPEREAEEIWGASEALEHTEHNAALQDPEGNLNAENGYHQDELDKPEFNSPRPDIVQDVSRTTTPHSLTPEPSTKHLKSPPATVPGSPDREPSIPNPTASAALVVPEDAENETDTTPAQAEKVDEVSTRLDVVIIYQDTEFALFSTSESDDPDSFFLSDLSIADQPLANFFKAIRYVIQDDLADEDELYLSVEDLTLELEEHAPAEQDITVKRIASLYEQLLRNDGVEFPRPLHAIIGVRPKFSIRFANLAAGAAEGKGLSELVTWDGHSEIYDDLGEVEDVQQSDELTEESWVEAEGPAENETKVSEHSATDYALDELDTPLDQTLTLAPQDTEEPGPTDLLRKDPGQSNVSDPSPVETYPEKSMTTTANSGEYDEDGDIIDYSDEEVETLISTKKDAVSQRAKLETDDSRTQNEYEAKNEELRRRSLSRAVEDNQTKPATEHPANAENDEDQNGNEVDFEDGVDYDDETYEEPLGHGNAGVEHEDLPVEDEEAHHSENLPGEVQKDSSINGIVSNDGTVEGIMETSESWDEHQTNGERQSAQDDFETFHDEVDLSKDDEARPQDLPSPHDDIANGNYGNVLAETQPPKKEPNPGGSSFENGEIVDSESVESEKTLEGQSTLNIEDEDEINYDDDDEEDDAKDIITIPETALKTEKVLLPHTGSGKRARIDADSDDGASTRSKEAKRPRP